MGFPVIVILHFESISRRKIFRNSNGNNRKSDWVVKKVWKWFSKAADLTRNMNQTPKLMSINGWRLDMLNKCLHLIEMCVVESGSETSGEISCCSMVISSAWARTKKAVTVLAKKDQTKKNLGVATMFTLHSVLKAILVTIITWLALVRIINSVYEFILQVRILE